MKHLSRIHRGILGSSNAHYEIRMMDPTLLIRPGTLKCVVHDESECL